MLNPDGAEYDMSGGHWHQWRKNRQPTPDPSEIGIDLNRNWGYHWGGGSGKGTDGSANPRATTTGAGPPRSRRRSRTTSASRRAESSTVASRSWRASASTPPRARFCGRTRTPQGSAVRHVGRRPRRVRRAGRAHGRAQWLQAAAGQRPVPGLRRPGRLGVPHAIGSSRYTIEMTKGAANATTPVSPS